MIDFVHHRLISYITDSYIIDDWFRTSFTFLFWAPLLEKLWSSWAIKRYYFYNFTFLRDSSFYFRCSWFSLTFLWWLIGNCIRNIGNEKTSGAHLMFFTFFDESVLLLKVNWKASTCVCRTLTINYIMKLSL